MRRQPMWGSDQGILPQSACSPGLSNRNMGLNVQNSPVSSTAKNCQCWSTESMSDRENKGEPSCLFMKWFEQSVSPNLVYLTVAYDNHGKNSPVYSRGPQLLGCNPVPVFEPFWTGPQRWRASACTHALPHLHEQQVCIYALICPPLTENRPLSCCPASLQNLKGWGTYIYMSLIYIWERTE